MLSIAFSCKKLLNATSSFNEAEFMSINLGENYTFYY